MTNENNEEQAELFTETGHVENAELSAATLEKLSLQDYENEPDFDPDAPTAEDAAAAEAEAARKAAEAEARKLEKAQLTVIDALGMYETGIQLGAHSRYVLPDDEKAAVAANLAPAVVKYLPEDFDIKSALFGRYMPEIMGVIGVYMLGKSTVVSIRALKAEDAEKKRQQAEAKRREQAEAQRRAANPEKVAA